MNNVGKAENGFNPIVIAIHYVVKGTMEFLLPACLGNLGAVLCAVPSHGRHNSFGD